MTSTDSLKKFFDYVKGDKVYGISIKFTPHTYLWIDDRFPAVNLLFAKRDYDMFKTKYGILKDEMFVVFDGPSATFEFENEKGGKLKHLFQME